MRRFPHKLYTIIVLVLLIGIGINSILLWRTTEIKNNAQIYARNHDLIIDFVTKYKDYTTTVAQIDTSIYETDFEQIIQAGADITALSDTLTQSLTINPYPTITNQNTHATSIITAVRQSITIITAYSHHNLCLQTIYKTIQENNTNIANTQIITTNNSQAKPDVTGIITVRDYLRTQSQLSNSYKTCFTPNTDQNAPHQNTIPLSSEAQTAIDTYVTSLMSLSDKLDTLIGFINEEKYTEATPYTDTILADQEALYTMSPESLLFTKDPAIDKTVQQTQQTITDYLNDQP